MILNTAFRTTLATSFIDELASAVVRLYSGSRPAGPATAITGQTLLAEMVLNNPAGTVSNGVATIDVTNVSDTSANASGTPTFVRILASNGTTVLADCSAGVGSGEWVLSEAVTSANPVPLISASFTCPAGT